MKGKRYDLSCIKRCSVPFFFFFFLFSSHRVRNWNDTFCISTSIGSYVDEAQIRVRDNHWLGKGRVEGDEVRNRGERGYTEGEERARKDIFSCIIHTSSAMPSPPLVEAHSGCGFTRKSKDHAYMCMDICVYIYVYIYTYGEILIHICVRTNRYFGVEVNWRFLRIRIMQRVCLPSFIFFFLLFFSLRSDRWWNN